MKRQINIYCDESCHLENDGQPHMGWGAFVCPSEGTRIFNLGVAELLRKHKMPSRYEIKWNKVSSGKLPFFLELVDFYFKNSEFGFRAVIVPEKRDLDHERFGSDHNTFYYKMYFYLLDKMLSEDKVVSITLDKKDTIGGAKTRKLREVLCNSQYDFKGELIKNIQIASSHKFVGIQMADFLLGAVMYANRGLTSSDAKVKIVEKIRMLSGKTLTKKTLQSEYKMNIFPWDKR